VYRNLVIAVLLGALALRVAAACWWERRLPDGVRFGFGDSESYWVLAKTIARGEPYQMGPDRRVFRTPGYPLLLAGLFVFAGDEPPVLWARMLNAVLGTVAVAGVMVLARLLFDRQTALLAGLIASVYPEGIMASALVLTEAPFGPFLLLHLILWVLASRASRLSAAIWLGVGGGLAAGVATLIRPSWLLFTPFALVLAFPWRRQVWIGVAMLAALCAVMTPWWIRNAQVVGTFVPTTLQVGESLYDGWHPAATGASDMRFVDEFRRQLRDEDARRPLVPGDEASFEERLDQRMRDAACRWARENPGRALALAGTKFLRMWNLWPNEPSLRQGPGAFIVMLGYVPVLVAALGGAYWFGIRGWPFRLCLLPAVYFTCLHVVFVGSIRYREPAMLPLIVLAAGFAGSWLWKGQPRRPGRSQCGAAAPGRMDAEEEHTAP
jgi:4-amino-4-deoxy-L-arabinose transferase-like glycosyltransferase